MKQSKNVQRGFSVHPDWTAALSNIRIVLVGLTHPGNIGAIARVMKNMALCNLTLVSSTNCGPETEAVGMASGAYDIVQEARITRNISEALDDCLMTVGTSGRIGRKRSDARTPDEVIPELMSRALTGPVACVFGRESRGLTNEEMKLCTHQMIIPTDGQFASMNVAHACTIAAYEVFKISSRPRGFQVRHFRPASVREREEMYQHVEEVLVRAGFLDPSNPLLMMRDIRRILNSAQIDDRDVKIVRGLFRKMGNMVRIADERIHNLSAKNEEE